jgi:hypothetical protein
MARMPGAVWVGPHHDNGTMSRYDIVCVHTIVGTAPAHAAHFSTTAGGTIYQSRDTAYRSAANADGNYRIIAVENADRGTGFPNWNINDGHAVPAFTDEQVTAIAKILAWAHKTHGVPLQLCPNSKPGSRGLAYHRQGIDGNFGGYRYGGRVSGGELWTAAYGKVCPGDRRIAQLPEILARAKRINNGEDPEGDWFDMRSDGEIKELVKKAVDDSWTHTHVVNIKETVLDPIGSTEKTPRQHWQKASELHDNVLELQRESDSHTTALSELKAEVAELKADVKFLVEAVQQAQQSGGN